MEPDPPMDPEARTEAQPGSVPVESLSYRQAIEELERIVERVDHGDIELEASIAAVKRARALIERCRSILGTVEQELEQITPEAEEG